MEKFDREVLLKRIETCLMLAGSSQIAFARNIGLSQAHVSRVLAGERNNETIWERLVDLLGYDPRRELKGEAKRFLEAMAHPDGI